LQTIASEFLATAESAKFYATRKVFNGSVCVYIHAGPWFRVRAWEHPHEKSTEHTPATLLTLFEFGWAELARFSQDTLVHAHLAEVMQKVEVRGCAELIADPERTLPQELSNRNLGDAASALRDD